jgi:hypothetical protein
LDIRSIDWMQRELAKRLRLKKHRKYPDPAMRILLEEYPEEIEAAYLREDWDYLPGLAGPIYKAWVAGSSRAASSETRNGREGATVLAEELADSDESLDINSTDDLGDLKFVTKFDDIVAHQSKVFAEHLASQAVSGGVLRHSSDGPIRVYSGVKGFRVKHLGDQLLSSEQARELLTSPVAAHWPRLGFETLGVPIVGHTYQLTEGLRDKRGPYSLIEVPLPNSNFEPILDRRPLQCGPWEVQIEPEDARSNRKPRRELETSTGSWRILAFPGEERHIHRVLVRPQSVLGKLHNEVSQLIQRYPWEEQEATWFVLTGETPSVTPLTWQFRSYGDDLWEDSFTYGFITLKIEPWVPVEMVQEIFHSLQCRLRGRRRARLPEEKSLNLVQFVNEQVNVADLSLRERRERGRQLVAVWDDANPEDTYEGNTWKFWRDYHRTRKTVMTPTYRWRIETDTPSEKPPR